MTHYSVNEIFFSLQGEGVRAGTANVFVRFAGCNLTCKMESHGFDCDTEFSNGRTYTAKELAEEMARIGGPCRATVLTGGEPLLQVDDELLQQLKAQGWYIAVETNGTKPRLQWIDWLTCSPKVAEHAIALKDVEEVKYVRHAGQALPKPHCVADYYLLSPAWTSSGVDRASLEWCIQLCKENPKWRLSIQQHKIWKVR